LKKNIHICINEILKWGFFLFKNIFISILLFYVDTTSFEDISPQGISDDSSTGSRVHASRPASLDSGRTSTSNSNNNASLHEVKGML